MRSILNKESHIEYLLSHLYKLEKSYSSQDTNRIVMAFFCIHGLALLNSLYRIKNSVKENIIKWVYNLNITDCRDTGFRGSTFIGHSFGYKGKYNGYDTSNIAATYSGLCILKTFGESIDQLDKNAILATISSMQRKHTNKWNKTCHEGAFRSSVLGSEEDLRFVYCALAICYMLDNFDYIDTNLAKKYIMECQTYDGGIGLSPNLESHGGSTFCGIASLSLLSHIGCNVEIDDPFSESTLLGWLIRRITYEGLEGRTNKTPDSCYSFWIIGSLFLLGKDELIDHDIKSCIRDFILTCQNDRYSNGGGFSKYPYGYPDLLHTYYSLAWLSISNEDGLASLNTKLQIPFYNN